MSAEVQVLGLCRWSYPSELKAFDHDFATMDALRRYLYAPARLELRFFFLEHLVLPSIRNQTDPAFSVIFLVGDALPDQYRARLLDLVGDVPQIKVRFAPEGKNHKRLVRKVMQNARNPKAKVVAEFRLDDDDAVARDFVAQTRELYPALAPVLRDNKRAALDFCRGFILHAYSDDLDITPVLARFWTPALALFVRPDDRGSLIDYPHLRVWKQMPALTIERPPMFIRGAHDTNDSALAFRSKSATHYELDPAKMTALLDTRFGLDIDRLNRDWTAFRKL